MVYDNSKNLIGTSGLIGTIEPSYPKGVFDHATLKGNHRVTWEPGNNLRFASVVVKYNDGYIVAARSLYEVENIIYIIGRDILIAWVTAIVSISFIIGAIYLCGEKKINLTEIYNYCIITLI